MGMHIPSAPAVLHRYDELFPGLDPSRMSSLLLADAWGGSGLDLLRPANVDQALRAWLDFGAFGALHWPANSPREESRDPARQLVSE